MLSVLCALVASQSPPKLALERWEVDARYSTIGFDAESTLHDFTGKTHAITGELRFDPGSVSTCAGGAVWIETWTLDTDNSSRDKDMRETFDVEKYPQIVFTLESVEGQLVDGRGEFTGHGRFFIHGRERQKTVRFRVEPAEDGRLHVLGEANLKLSEHDVKPPKVLFVKVGDGLRVWLDLRLARVAEKPLGATVSVAEVRLTRTNPKSGAPETTTGVERVWIAPAGVLWERPLTNVWTLVTPRSEGAFDPRSAASIPLVGAPVAGAVPGDAPKVEYLEPAPGTVVIRYRDKEWFRAEGLSGDVPIGRLALAFGDVDERVRAEIAKVKGMPQRIVLRGRSSENAEVQREITFTAGRPASLPDWALDPTAWTRPPTVKIVEPKLEGAPEKRDKGD